MSAVAQKLSEPKRVTSQSGLVFLWLESDCGGDARGVRQRVGRNRKPSIASG